MAEYPLFDKISPLVGCLYALSSLPLHSPSSSSSSHCTCLGLACLVGTSGQFLVPSDAILSATHLPCTPSRLVVDFPNYYAGDQPLRFLARIAYLKRDCEVCILIPADEELVTRCIKFDGFTRRCIKFDDDEESLQQGDSVFCLHFDRDLPAKYPLRRRPTVIEGRLALPIDPLYGMIVAFEHPNIASGMVVNSDGHLVGTHSCNFTVEEGDDALLPEAASRWGKVEIKDTIDGSTPSRTRPQTRHFPGMPPAVLAKVQAQFAATGSRRKQKAELSKVFTFSSKARGGEMLQFLAMLKQSTLAFPFSLALGGVRRLWKSLPISAKRHIRETDDGVRYSSKSAVKRMRLLRHERPAADEAELILLRKRRRLWHNSPHDDEDDS